MCGPTQMGWNVVNRWMDHNHGWWMATQQEENIHLGIGQSGSNPCFQQFSFEHLQHETKTSDLILWQAEIVCFVRKFICTTQNSLPPHPTTLPRPLASFSPQMHKWSQYIQHCPLISLSTLSRVCFLFFECLFRATCHLPMFHLSLML